MKAAKKFSLGLAVLAILCIAAAGYYWSHDDAFNNEGLVEADTPDLKHTLVSPVLDAPLASGNNVLWCGTFQLAWNEACSLFGGDLHFEDEHATVGLLNQKSFTKDNIDEGSYIAVAGFVKDDVHGQISRELQDTFHGQATPRYLPANSPASNSQDVVVYCYLFKNLEFPVPFEHIEKPLVFGKEKVPCFGIGWQRKEEHREMRRQVDVLYYRDEDHFAIELITKSERDHLILAKMPPETTLDATVTEVQKSMARYGRVPPRPGDVLMVPKINFDVTHHFDEIEGKRLITQSPDVPGNLYLATALQNVRFQLDEEGARLRSEAEMHFDSAEEGESSPPKKRIMIFNKPFLIMLQRAESETPYFALWVEDSELLEKVK